MGTNPFQDATEKVSRSAQRSGLDIARVERVDTESHMVAIKAITETADGRSSKPEVATVTVTERGDVNLPERGDTVVVARFKNRRPVVLGSYYTRSQQLRDASEGERHIGADDSNGLFLHGPFGVVPKVVDDPDDAPDGAVWYRSDVNEYRGVEDETTVTFDTTPV